LYHIIPKGGDGKMVGDVVGGKNQSKVSRGRGVWG